MIYHDLHDYLPGRVVNPLLLVHLLHLLLHVLDGLREHDLGSNVEDELLL